MDKQMDKQRLEEIRARADKANAPYPVIHKEIDALPWVEAQLELKRHAKADIPELLARIATLTAALEDAEKRADAAERDMRTYIERNILETSGKFACDLCANGGDFDDWSGKECPEGCNGISNWQWRGPADTNGGQGDDA